MFGGGNPVEARSFGKKDFVGSSQEQVSQALWDEVEWKGPRCLLSSLGAVSAASQA